MVLNSNERIIIKPKSRPALEPIIEEETDPQKLFFEICSAIREGGYNPVSQISGYLISEDPTHITNYKSARTLISKLDRDDLLEEMVKCYIEAIDKEFEGKNSDD